MALSRPLLTPRPSMTLAILAMLLYTMLVGASTSVVRAAIISGLTSAPRSVTGAESHTPRRNPGSWARQPRADHTPLTSSCGGCDQDSQLSESSPDPLA